MWIKSPKNGVIVNFDEVYKIRAYEYVSSDESQLTIDIYFFSKDIPQDGNYYTEIERKETFFSGDLEVGKQLVAWLEKQLDALEFHAIETPPTEVVINDQLMKNVVEACLKNLKEVGSLLPEGIFLNPFLCNVIGNSEAIDYIIERKNNGMFVSDIHKSWKLDFQLTQEILNSLTVILKSLKGIGAVPKLSEYQKDALRSVLGENEEGE